MKTLVHLLFLVAVCLPLPVVTGTEVSAKPQMPQPAGAFTPAPLFRDPAFDGAADPVLAWQPERKAWWMFYTQRRAKLDLPGVAWCHGTAIGVAESRDGGMTWEYLGGLPLENPNGKPGSFWAPDVIRDDAGTFHLFVTYVPGEGDKHVGWDGTRFIYQYTSANLWNWNLGQKIPTGTDHCIDASLCRMTNGSWRMWFKDEARGSNTAALESRDLKEWKPIKDPGVSKLYGEGPKTFQFKGSYWLIKDPNSGLDVYRSPDLENWTYQGKILEKPGKRNDDGNIGKHCDVVVCGERAFIIYFTHPDTQDFPEKNGILPYAARRSSIQAAELEVRDGKLVCDRDKPFRIQLTAPK